MDGTVVGIDHKAVIATLELYGEGKEMFEDIVMCFEIEQECQK